MSNALGISRMFFEEASPHEPVSPGTMHYPKLSRTGAEKSQILLLLILMGTPRNLAKLIKLADWSYRGSICLSRIRSLVRDGTWDWSRELER